MKLIEKFQLKAEKSGKNSYKDIYELVKLLAKEELETILNQISCEQVVVKDGDGNTFYGGTFVRFKKLSEIVNERIEEIKDMK